MDMYESLREIDFVRLNFNADSSLYLNITIAFIMLGVALELDLREFKSLIKNPKSPFLGIFAQFIFLPALTFLGAFSLQDHITPSVALGMILVAACPGGNVSNFISNLSKGNLALSVSLTSFSSVASLVMTPFNFIFWGNLYLQYHSGTDGSELLRSLQIDAWSVIKTLVLILALPLTAGVIIQHRFPYTVKKALPFVKNMSIAIFGALVIVIFSGNYELFLKYIKFIFIIVLFHNAIAMASGYFLGKAFRLAKKDCKTLAIETGIQNTGLALALLFDPEVFPSELPIGGMAFVAAWYGIWHILAGLATAFYFRRD